MSSKEQLNNVYENYESEFLSVLDKHAPIKTRKSRNKPLPCMNSELRSAIHKKHMLYSHFTKKQKCENMGQISQTTKFSHKAEEKVYEKLFSRTLYWWL